MFTEIIDKLKNFDYINILLIIMFIIIAFSVIVKGLKQISKKDFDIPNKKIGNYTINKICYDTNGVTECIEIPNNVYRLFLLNESQQNDTPTLYIKR